ncbi:MAG: electron transfer flavoprotein subunit beta [Candidatus Cloacimonetes bacterium 4572_65]|nr:MAG: electron transfer flavoprotein subunit beta [Candidatus Cloacimonetes bacterium 4572_65]
MNIIVCIKQVPDTTEIRIDPVTNTLIRNGVASILNPFDNYAVEEALRLKELHGGTVTAVTMGPPQAEEILKEVVSLGVDEIFLLSDRKFAGADTWATSHTLAAAIEKIGGYDLILFGQQAIDGDTAQVGPGVATHIGIPQTCFVRKIEKYEDGKMVCQRLMEDGYDIVEMQLPAVVSVVKEINTPRLPSLRGKRNARKAKPIVWNADDLNLDEKNIGLNGSPTQVVEIFSPEMHKSGEKFEGTPEDSVALILKSLSEISR